MNINLHIERLVLDGLTVTSGEAALLQTAVELELGRLLATRGLEMGLQAGGALPRVHAATIQYRAGENPIHLGHQIARSVYGRIGQTANSKAQQSENHAKPT